MHLSMLFAIHQCGQIKLIKTMLKYFEVLLGLSPVLNCYPKRRHMAEITKRPIIVYDEIEDRICKNLQRMSV